jgi:hypothetical protein
MSTLRHRSAVRTTVLGFAVGVSTLVSGYVALPLLPVTSLQGSAVIALNPDQGETVGSDPRTDYPGHTAATTDSANGDAHPTPPATS